MTSFCTLVALTLPVPSRTWIRWRTGRYYYRVSDGLVGGDLELMSKRPRAHAMQTAGECEPGDSLTVSESRGFLAETPRCRIPVRQGTLAVFSNYQLVHRVLRMRMGDAPRPATPPRRVGWRAGTSSRFSSWISALPCPAPA